MYSIKEMFNVVFVFFNILDTVEKGWNHCHVFFFLHSVSPVGRFYLSNCPLPLYQLTFRDSEHSRLPCMHYCAEVSVSCTVHGFTGFQVGMILVAVHLFKVNDSLNS